MSDDLLKNVKGLVEQAIEAEIIVEQDDNFVFEETILGKTKEAAIEFLKKNKKVLSEILNVLKEEADDCDESDDEDSDDEDEDSDDDEEEED